jgi:hypothetical protein
VFYRSILFLYIYIYIPACRSARRYTLELWSAGSLTLQRNMCPENGYSRFLRNGGYNPQYYNVSQSRRTHSEGLVCWHNSEGIRPMSSSLWRHVTQQKCIFSYEPTASVVRKDTLDDEGNRFIWWWSNQFHLKLRHVSTRLHGVNIPEVRSLHKHRNKNLSSQRMVVMMRVCAEAQTGTVISWSRELHCGRFHCCYSVKSNACKH